jgi:hypothetical protein
MVQSVIQTAFHAGEWAPSLTARVDLAKYKAGAALLRNFYVDYRGGVSSRPGTRYVTTALDSTNPVRLIPFQASTSVGYILEFGNFTMRVIANAALIAFGPLATPYAAADLALLKFTQLVDKLILCHPNYPPYELRLITATNWTLNPINFGSTVSQPAITGITTTNAGTGNFGYVVTAVDQNGQEGPAAGPVYSSINITAGAISTINLSWNSVVGAIAYNVYRTNEATGANPPLGSALGLISTVTGLSISDTFYSNSPQSPADFSISPPVLKDPFLGAGVDHTTVTIPGAYTGTVPSVTFSAPGAGGLNATGVAIAGVLSATVSITVGSAIGEVFSYTSSGTSVTLVVTAVDGFGNVTAVNVLNPGSIQTGGTIPTNPILFLGPHGNNAWYNLTWGITQVAITQAGYGYTLTPTITFSSGAAAATAFLQSGAGGNPSVPGIFQQRLVLAAKPLAVSGFDMSQPGSYYNFNISNPIQADDAISASLISGELNTIKSMVSVPTGLLVLTDKSNWLISGGGGPGSPVTAIDIAAHEHSHNGANDMPPIVANFDILFVQAKNSIVRDLTFQWYTQIYTGNDISVLSSHLFYGYTMAEWCWAEEPFKVVWVVRNDGTMLTMTYLKEQELIGWTHHDTNGLFKSVATITEPVQFTNATGPADMVYTVVERVINGATVKLIERFDQRSFFDDAKDAWFVDAGLKYTGPPTTSFSGAGHLGGAVVTGLADGVVITPFTMPLSGSFTLPNPASTVIIGLPYVCQLQTLRLDTGDPTIQGKRKSVAGVTVRVQQTLGLTIGKSIGRVVSMKDLVIGNVGSSSNSVVTQLVTGDARTILDSSWDTFGQYFIQQAYPLPATILGVIPEIDVGDTK